MPLAGSGPLTFAGEEQRPARWWLRKGSSPSGARSSDHHLLRDLRRGAGGSYSGRGGRRTGIGRLRLHKKGLASPTASAGSPRLAACATLTLEEGRGIMILA